ncbi:hypothetical protein [Amycolatopsis samaneae]|uniref:Uncharacterized protein n=1 Tax=Amycolatopsis samaneae TaxID=664691 RepID=A0ABW5GTF6_9PSEU
MSWKSQPRGPDGRWIKKGTLAAAATAGVVVAGAAGGIGGGGAASSVGQGARSVTSQAKTSSKDSARKGQRDTAWRRMGLKIARKAAESELRCASRSFGQAQQFFLRTPCRKLDRLLLALGLAEIRFTGRYYDSHREGTLVVNAEATPIGGRPGEEFLRDVADVADEFPPP